MYKTFEKNNSTSVKIPAYENPKIATLINSFLADRGLLFKYIPSVGLSEDKVIDYYTACKTIGIHVFISRNNEDCYFRYEDKTLILPSWGAIYNKFIGFGYGCSFREFADHMHERYVLFSIAEHICYINGETLCNDKERKETPNILINSDIVRFLKRSFYKECKGKKEDQRICV